MCDLRMHQVWLISLVYSLVKAFIFIFNHKFLCHKRAPTCGVLTPVSLCLSVSDSKPSGAWSRSASGTSQATTAPVW